MILKEQEEFQTIEESYEEVQYRKELPKTETLDEFKVKIKKATKSVFQTSDIQSFVQLLKFVFWSCTSNSKIADVRKSDPRYRNQVVKIIVSESGGVGKSQKELAKKLLNVICKQDLVEPYQLVSGFQMLYSNAMAIFAKKSPKKKGDSVSNGKLVGTSGKFCLFMLCVRQENKEREKEEETEVSKFLEIVNEFAQDVVNHGFMDESMLKTLQSRSKFCRDTDKVGKMKQKIKSLVEELFTSSDLDEASRCVE